MSLLESIQRLASHLPTCVLRDLVQKVQEDNEKEGPAMDSAEFSRDSTESGVSLLQARHHSIVSKKQMSGDKESGDSSLSSLLDRNRQGVISSTVKSEPSEMETATEAAPVATNRTISKQQLEETLATVEKLLEEDLSSEHDDSCTAESSSSRVPGSKQSNHTIHYVSDDDDTESDSSYGEPLSDLEKDVDEEIVDFDASYGETNVAESCLSGQSIPGSSLTRLLHSLSQSSVPSRVELDDRFQGTVSKLRQGRLVSRNTSFETIRNTNSQDGRENIEQTVETPVTANWLPTSHHRGALLLADISGFTKLSTTLPVESFSKVIDTYFHGMVKTISEYGGDIQKFAGDAILAEWRVQEDRSDEQAALSASLCAVELVNLCSDFPVYVPFKSDDRVSSSGDDNTPPTKTLLNIHVAVGFGDIIGAHIGEPTHRMEYVLLGSALRQILDAIPVAKLGEAVVTPEVLELFGQFADIHIPDRRKGKMQVLAFKEHQFFEGKHVGRDLKAIVAELSDDLRRKATLGRCDQWTKEMLAKLQQLISLYVHAVVVADEDSYRCHTPQMRTEQRISIAADDALIQKTKRQQSLAELRDVCSVFIQPDVPMDQLASDEAAAKVADLNSIMSIINSEVDRYGAHMRQFIVDDKGLVIIINFGLRGSTYPNMIDERVMPFISRIRTLLDSEVEIGCQIGATHGPAFCGVATTGNRTEYTVFGPAVNLAARLMSHTRNLGVVVDEGMKLKAGNRPFTSICPIEAKGYNDFVPIYIPDLSQKREWKESEMVVARQLEVARLVSHAKAVIESSNSRSRMVFLNGPFGVGKSALLSYAVSTIEGMCTACSTDILVLRHVCCNGDSFTPFSFVRPFFLEMLRGRTPDNPYLDKIQLVGHSNTNEADEIEEAQLYVTLLQMCLEAEIPLVYVEVFAGLIFSATLSHVGKWSEASTKMSEWNNLANLLVKLSLHGTRNRELVMLGLDDMSELDEMSWKVIKGLFHCATNVFLMGVGRNEFDLNISAYDWTEIKEAEEQFFHMTLENLDEVGVSELVKNHMEAKGWTRFECDMSRTVYLESKGNPLLAGELLDALYPSIASSNDSVLNKSVIKDVEDLVLNRLDSLSPSFRCFLQLGAIMGSPFYLADIISVMERYHEMADAKSSNVPESAREALQEAADNGLLIVSAYEWVDFGICEPAAYSFSHSIWQETISRQLLNEWRNTMQRLINDVVVNGKAPRVPVIFPLKRSRPSNMPVIIESAGEDQNENSECGRTKGNIAMPVNKQIKAMTNLFRRSYQISGRKGAKKSLQKLRKILSGGSSSHNK